MSKKLFTLVVLLWASLQAYATPTELVLYTEMTPGIGDGDPGTGAVFNGELFFEAMNAGGNDEPWRFDGTTLVQIPNANPLPANDSNLTAQFVFNNRLYAVMESDQGRELFEYNTTTQVYERHSNFNGAADGFPIPLKDANGDLIIYNGNLLMGVDVAATDRQLHWLRADNNVLEPVPGATAFRPSNLAVFNGNLYYEGRATVGGDDEPFRLIGSTQTQITNANPRVGDSNLTDQFVFNNRLYAVMESDQGRELFEYDFASNTYNRHSDFNGIDDGFPNPLQDENDDLIIFGGDLLMSVDVTATDRGLYRLRADNNILEPVPGATAFRPSNVTVYEGNIYYEGRATVGGDDEPFRLVGATQSQITNANPPAAGDSNLTFQFKFIDDLYAVMESSTGREMFKLNAAGSSYERLIDLNGAAADGFPIAVTDENGGPIIYLTSMLFSADGVGIGDELFRLTPLIVPPEFSINDVSLSEGNAGTSNLSFTVTRSNNTSAASVNFATANGTATAGSDYSSNSGTLNFTNGGNLTQTVNVVINGDTLVEANETLTVNLSAPSAGASISDGQGIGTINNDDTATVTIADVAVNENSGTATITLTSSAAIDGGFDVDVSTADGTATTADGDYTAVTSATETFAGTAGETETFTITLGGDTKVEADETVSISMSGLSPVTVSSGSIDITDGATLTLNNDDSAAVTIANVAVNENSGTATITLTLDNAVDGGFDVDVSTADGTATTADADYTAVTSATETFAGTAGETETLTVTLGADTKVENDETVSISMSGLSPVTVSSGNIDITDGATLTILNDDSATVSINDISLNEGDSGNTTFDFTVSLLGQVQGGFAVDVNTLDGTATTASGDYNTASNRIFFGNNANQAVTFSVNVNGDTTLENDETFTAALSNLQAGGLPVSIGTAIGTATILNDDVASLSIADASITEGDGGGSNLNFVVTLSGDVNTGVSIDFATSDGTALAGSDYTSNSGTLNFAGTDGETQNVSVVISGDTVTELDEVFNVTLSNISDPSISISDATASGTITNDDAATLSIDSVSLTEGNAGTTNFTFTVSLDNQVDTAFSVDAATADGTAAAGSDYVSNNGTLNFAGNAAETQTISVVVNGDAVVEANEAFTVNLSNLVASSRDITLAVANGTGTINNDDSATLSITDVALAEGNAGTTTFGFSVSLSGAVQDGVSVDFTTSDGTATGTDYTTTAGTLNFVGNNNESQQINVSVLGDAVVELNETFNLTISNASVAGVTLADDLGVGTINNDDTATLSIDDISLNEGNAGTTAFDFTVSLNGTVDAAFNVDAATADGTATVAANDYSATSNTLNFNGSTDQTLTFSVPVNGDTAVETDEDFTATLSNLAGLGGRNVTIADNSGTATIVNDDSASISISDATIAEGDSGTVNLVFDVTLGSLVKDPLTVDYATADDTATAGSDYTSNNGTLNFVGSPGEVQTITVVLNGDAVTELDETLFVNLSNISSPDVTISDAQAVGTISNDDLAALSIDDVTSNEGNAGTTNYTFTVSLDNAVDTALSIDIASADGSATVAANDYVANSDTLNFAGTAGESQTFTVVVNGDLAVESDENFDVILNNLNDAGRGVTLSDSVGTGTILNDDSSSISITDASNTEGNTVNSVLTFDVTLGSQVKDAVSVDYNTVNVTATAGSDYTAVSGTLNFAGIPGETLQVQVPVIADMAFEGDETLELALSNVTVAGVTLDRSSAVGTIIDDDPEVTASNTALVNAPAAAGDTITYEVAIRHNGPTATGVVFTTNVDPNLTVIGGTLSTSAGTIIDGSDQGDATIIVDIGDLPININNLGGSDVLIRYQARINGDVAVGEIISNQGTISGTNFADVLTDDPNTPLAGDPTLVGVGEVRPVPTLGTWSLLIMLLLMGWFGRKRLLALSHH
ncbi:hypothetical protein OS175_01595 [Marinicella sp. S1101]|uniref:Calx-beta domain-containing protein n=1 Tax=Marinicella marina TaxID=2996016 RepID=UPI002260C98F|nr:Calx-beta domain-containing protein [Marinicella marina]MCX7552556.1 hypothetical protein [Marinicella marina]MDJ1139432.1 Calx-beta domain-containing protein [Marinicella marina]